MSRLPQTDFAPEFNATMDYRLDLSKVIIERIMNMQTPHAVGLILTQLATGDLEVIARFLERNRHVKG